MRFSLLDLVVFSSYFLGIIIFGVIIAARSKTKSSGDFFLASKTLPWYVVGASFIAANISTEHFIGMVGWGFLYGMSVAQWEWGNVTTFTILIWIFLPFYMRGNVATMPEFLERRYNKWCRHIYALVMIIGLVIAMLGGVMFAGAKAMSIFFPQIPMTWAIILLAVGAGGYTIYGGLLSVAWVDLVQYVLLMIGGLLVLFFGLYHIGDFRVLIEQMPEKFLVIYPPTHEMIPFTGLVLGIFSVGIWYSCANQFMVQRCLGARSEWDARMGVVMAGFSKALLPFIVVVPGIIAFYVFQDRLSDGDQSWPFLVKTWLPTGVVGLVLAGLASAILSTLSAISNSSGTIFTLDLYKSILRPNADDRELHRVGRLSTAAALLAGSIIAIIISNYPGLTVFQIIQQVFFYIAGPTAAIFLVGIMWRRATPMAALWTLIIGFLVFLPLTKYLLFPYIWFLKPFDNFMHHSFVVFVFSCLVLIILSLFTKPKSDEELRGVIWSRKALGFLPEEKKLNRGIRNLTLWWGLMVLLLLSLYTFTHLQGMRTRWIEAENLSYSVQGGGQTRLQARSELAQKERFNLWTGRGQVLFTPDREGEALTFDIPLKKSGTYKLAALVTMGPDYGSFAADVNGRPAQLSYPMTFVTPGKNDHKVRIINTDLFQGRTNSGTGAGNSDALPDNLHFVHRITFGIFKFSGERATLSFIARDVPNGRSAFIGVDQIMLTRVK